MKRSLARYGVFALVAVLLGSSALMLGAKSSGSKKKGYLIRPKFWEDQKLKYRLEVEGDVRWTPKKPALLWGKVDTEFVFTLTEKAIREDGACIFDLAGERLKSKVDGPEGRVSVSATRSQWEVQREGHRRYIMREKNPLKNPMTVTIGPRGEFRGGTGLAPIARFFVAHMDRKFWDLLTVAPAEEVNVGDKWRADFKLQLPDSRGEPLQVDVEAKVTGWKKYGAHNCLVCELRAKAELKNTEVMLRNGDRIEVKSGKYEARGNVMWDLKQGLLCSAEAESTLSIICTKRSKTSFTGKAKAKLKLLSAR